MEAFRQRNPAKPSAPIAARSEVDGAGIDQNHRSIGASAVDLLAGQINRNERGKPEHPKEINIRGKFTDGFTIRPQ